MAYLIKLLISLRIICINYSVDHSKMNSSAYSRYTHAFFHDFFQEYTGILT